MKYYDLHPILSRHALYNVIFGQRSNGKTFATCDFILENYAKKGKQGAWVRRYQYDFRGGKGANHAFDGVVNEGRVKHWTDGAWEGVKYWAGRYYLTRTNEKGEVELDDRPFCFGYALSDVEHDKGGATFPDITTIVFDEFISRIGYLDTSTSSEFLLFENVISTIVRNRTDVTIFMLGNTVNKYCPYYKEMGLTHVKDMKQGTIDVYEYNKEISGKKLTVAVEYADSMSKKGKPSDIYFAFDNPRLKMITTGDWEISVYPHLFARYKPKDVIFIYYIVFDGDTLQCEIINNPKGMFTFVHRKTTPIKDETERIVFTKEWDHRSNFRRRLTYPPDDVGTKINWFYDNERVCYQSNEVGEIVRNYLMWSNGDSDD